MDTSEQYIKMADCEEIQEGKSQPFHMMHQNIEHIIDDGEFWFFTSDGWTTEKVWLPRQDQLQEMVEVDEYPYTLVEKFWSWFDMHNKSGEKIDYESMEQLWLAFVLKEKFSKTWDGDKWVK